MSNMPALRTLSMHCAYLALNSTSLLPDLDRLSLHVQVGSCKELLDLSWLKLQRVDKLDLCLDIPAWNAEASQQAVAELQQIQVSYLHVIVNHFPFREEIQTIWGQYTACDHFHPRLCSPVRNSLCSASVRGGDHHITSVQLA